MIIPLPQDPVFIVGYPRSGTTLLQRFLVAQAGFYSFPETHFFSVAAKRIQPAEVGHVSPADLGVLLAAMIEKTGFRISEEDRADLARTAQRDELSMKNVFELMVSRLLAPQFGQKPPSAAWRWVEKTPTHANFLECILPLYPEAQVLHIVRHPVPAIASRRSKFPFNRETPLEQLAHAWNRLDENVSRGRALFPASIISLRYEDLVADARKELAAVGAFLRMPWDMERLNLPRGEAGLASLALPSEAWKLEDSARDVVNTNESYRESLPAADVERIESIVGERMRQHGYGHFACAPSGKMT
jgi:hypothetical protein